SAGGQAWRYVQQQLTREQGSDVVGDRESGDLLELVQLARSRAGQALIERLCEGVAVRLRAQEQERVRRHQRRQRQVAGQLRAVHARVGTVLDVRVEHGAVAAGRGQRRERRGVHPAQRRRKALQLLGGGGIVP